ncbi:MAG: cadherin-like domain-containing protein [Oscillospiraceae bacterium]|nr:cadherin-like domain-containing protein [Oscillospiraceae bacterium]
MRKKNLLCLALALCCVLTAASGVAALEVECDATYCFSGDDFAGEERLTGICITGLPDADAGTAMLGHRVLRPGDILTADQLAQMTFAPLRTETDREAIVTYLPIYENRVAPSATMTISIKGKSDCAPVAEDYALETYKNLPITGTLKVSDPEGEALTYTLTRQPKRGSVSLNADGTFEYTPKKNKVGVDSFVFTATDPRGNVSREATVTIRILKPTDATQYTDTVGSECRFAAEWMKNTGLFVGEQMVGEYCFNENTPVSRGQFLAMAVKVLGIPTDTSATYTGYTDDIPSWLKPYLAAAMRSGMTAGLPAEDSGAFGAFENITGGEAAVMLQNALDLAVSVSAEVAVGKNDAETHWAAAAVTAMSENGIDLPLTDTLTRGQAAILLYQISKMTPSAPGLQMYQ